MMFTGAEKDMEIVRTKELSKRVSFHQVERVSAHGVAMYRVMPFERGLPKCHHLPVTQSIRAICQTPVQAAVAEEMVLSE